jgi:hypothetical protein
VKARNLLKIFSFVVLPIGVLVACGSSTTRNQFTEDGLDGGDMGGFGEGGFEGGEGGGDIGGRDPVSCDEAAQFKTYVGCDYWPTPGANLVADVFDFAAAVANVGTDTANVTVTGPNGVNKKISVKGGELGKVYLPWVPSLKGPSNGMGIRNSVLQTNGAYHLVSDKPVVVYQFNPLEFRAVGGEPGKDWSSCVKQPGATECYSYSNDASLLLPSTAMTGTYRIMGSLGFSRHPVNLLGQVDTSQPLQANAPPYFLVTGTAKGTNVTVKLGPKGQVTAGGGIMAAPAGGTLTFTLDAGDVAEVVGGVGRSYDFSGSLLKADKPVQVITGVPCMDMPLDVQACDHVEETVFPAETLGKHYVVTTPTGPKNNHIGQVVRFYGNSDGTHLTYKPSQPPGCPTMLNAGDVIDCGGDSEQPTNVDFEVTGDKEFGVAMFMLGGEKADPDFNPASLMQPQGDPSQSFAVAVEQYRKRYVFLAPNDYKTSYVDVVCGKGTTVTLEGQDMTSQFKELTGTDYLIGRLALGAGKDGTHVLQGSDPIGIQVIGYGDNTSYQYPGGLNLSAISAAPVK